jgi:hypothetical protein
LDSFIAYLTGMFGTSFEQHTRHQDKHRELEMLSNKCGWGNNLKSKIPHSNWKFVFHIICGIKSVGILWLLISTFWSYYEVKVEEWEY